MKKRTTAKKTTTTQFRERLTSVTAEVSAAGGPEVADLTRGLIDVLSVAYARGGLLAVRRALDTFKALIKKGDGAGALQG
jgi:hypothetical protein